MCALREHALRKAALSPFMVLARELSASRDSHAANFGEFDVCVALSFMHIDANALRSAAVLNVCDFSPSRHLTRNEPFLCHIYLKESF